MPLEFYLVPNHLSPEAEDYMAVSRNPQTYSLEDIFRRVTREGSTITTAEAMAVFEEITRGIIDVLQEGNAVTTPLLNGRSTIAGTFKGDEDTFDAARHSVHIRLTPGKRLHGVTDMIETRKVPVPERHPDPLHYYDNHSDTQDRHITPGAGARIDGSLLKFDEADERQGIFIIADDGAETRIDIPLLRNKPSELIFMNPPLPPGSCRLEVRAVIHRTTDLRTGTLRGTLTVKDT